MASRVAWLCPAYPLRRAGAGNAFPLSGAARAPGNPYARQRAVGTVVWSEWENVLLR